MDKTINNTVVTMRDAAPHTTRTAWQVVNSYNGRTDNISMVVSFGLHYLSGNSTPYFSITADGRENGRESFGGCCHDEIAKHCPNLTDVIALHLSGIDGAPMHADGNGFYWLAGIVDMDEKYHGGSGDYGKAASECIRIAAKHFRITQGDAVKLAGMTAKVYRAQGTTAAKAFAKEFTDAQRPRWKREALACVTRWELGIYGDMQKTHSETVAMMEGE